MPNSPRDATITYAPDLSSPKWHGYVRKSGLPMPMETSPPLQNKSSRSPSKLVPEFAHLAVSRDAPRTPRSNRSVDDLPPSPSSPRSTASTHASSTMRRYAKTPVLRIGQLEGYYNAPLPPLPPGVSDVELIAEQYRALLSSRCHDRFEEGGTEDEDEDEEEQWYDAEDTRQQSMEMIRSAMTRRKSPPAQLLPPPRLRMQPPTPPAGHDDDDGDDDYYYYNDEILLDDGAEGSPTSDGTLVDFEEDAIYFKPAFSPNSLSPIPEDGACSPVPSSDALPPPRTDAHALGLQICMDLLTGELASSLRQARPRRVVGAAAEVPSLQVWLMIEAYEKLRERVSGMLLGREQERALDDMFGMWLGALYKVHDSLAGARKSWSPSEGEVESLQVVDVD